jgi:DNA primase small subunit
VEAKQGADGPEEKSRVKDYKKTSMLKATVIFEEFMRKLETSYRRRAQYASDMKMDY